MPVVTYEDAIKIAKEYAEEVAKKQREICASEIKAKPSISNGKFSTNDLRLPPLPKLREAVLNAPLATEEGDK